MIVLSELNIWNNKSKRQKRVLCVFQWAGFIWAVSMAKDSGQQTMREWFSRDARDSSH